MTGVCCFPSSDFIVFLYIYIYIYKHIYVYNNMNTHTQIYMVLYLENGRAVTIYDWGVKTNGDAVALKNRRVGLAVGF